MGLSGILASSFALHFLDFKDGYTWRLNSDISLHTFSPVLFKFGHSYSRTHLPVIPPPQNFRVLLSFKIGYFRARHPSPFSR